MKILVDECCSPAIAMILRQEGHDVAYVPEDTPSLTDNNILGQGLKEERIILTEDRDFGELVFLNQLPSYGIVLVRIPHSVPRDQRLQRIRDLFSEHEEKLIGSMITLTMTAIRAHSLPFPFGDQDGE